MLHAARRSAYYKESLTFYDGATRASLDSKGTPLIPWSPMGSLLPTLTVGKASSTSRFRIMLTMEILLVEWEPLAPLPMDLMQSVFSMPTTGTSQTTLERCAQ
jgi:hypothetical protein